MCTVFRSVLSFILVLAWSGAFGNEEDIFDADTFLDPQALGIEPRAACGQKKSWPVVIYEEIRTQAKEESRPECGQKMTYWTAVVGRVWNYQDRSSFTDQDRELVSIQYNRHWLQNQLSAQITSFTSHSGFTDLRTTLQYGRYVSRRSQLSGSDYVYRNLYSIIIDEVDGQRDLEYEVVFQHRLELAEGIKELTRGGFSLSHRFRPGDDITRLLWKSSGNVYDKGPVTVNLAGWVGGERLRGHSVWVPFRARAQIEWQLKGDLILTASWAPAKRTKSRFFMEDGNDEFFIGLRGIFSANIR